MQSIPHLFYSLIDWANSVPTSNDEKTSSCFVQNMAGKRSCTNDEETSHHNSEHSQEHKNCPETSINWRKGRRKEGIQHFLELKQVTYLANKEFSFSLLFSLDLSYETLILLCIYILYHMDQIRFEHQPLFDDHGK